MRNWLRKWLGLAEVEQHANEELTRIATEAGEAVDKLVAANADRESRFEKELNRLLDEESQQLSAKLGNAAASLIESDNAILKRLLFVEMSMGIVPREDGIPTVGDTLRKLGEAHKALDGKCTTNKELLDKALAEVVEYRMEVRAVKDGVEKIALVSEASQESDRIDPEIRACLEQSSKSPNKKSAAKPKKAR